MIDIPTETLTGERNGTGIWVEGRFVKSSQEILSFEASVQPTRGNDTKVLEEHLRSAESIKIYTEFKLRIPDEQNQLPGDTVNHDGKVFEIHSVANWAIGTDIPHYKCIGVKQDGQGGGNAT